MSTKTFLRVLTCVSTVFLTLPPMVVAQVSQAAAGDPKLTQGFSVVLVLGDLKGDSTIASDMPAGARHALADMKDFLPYHSYKLLDTTWILNNVGGRASSRLRGPDGVDYEVTVSGSVTYRSVSGGAQESSLTVKFSLKDPGSGMVDAAASGASVIDVARLEEELAALQLKYGAKNPEVMRKSSELVAARARVGHPARIIIDTSFNMNGNETVVVGTSRVQGDSALIALLTAVPRAAK
jgi:hypothetical protein